MPIGIASMRNAAARPNRVASTAPISVIQWTSERYHRHGTRDLCAPDNRSHDPFGASRRRVACANVHVVATFPVAASSTLTTLPRFAAKIARLGVAIPIVDQHTGQVAPLPKAHPASASSGSLFETLTPPRAQRPSNFPKCRTDS